MSRANSTSRTFHSVLLAGVGVCLWGLSLPVSAQMQLIVNYREPVTRASTPDIPAEITKARLFERQKRTLEDFSTQLGNSTRWVRNMSGNAAVVAVDDGQTLHEIRQRLSALEYVESVDIDALVWPAAVPNDELYGEQWQLGSSDQSAGAINAEAAWDLVSGDASTVIAVIDTGIRSEHPDLQGRLLPGYDFVSGMNLNIEGDVPIPLQYEYLRANDGDGRDPDPTDPGDGVEFSTTVEMNTYGVNCPATASTWHGTAVASVIAANSNDGFGMAGLAQHTKILPVRSMGRCGGRRSDLIDAIRWAAGVGDPAITENLYPADIINLSLGVDDVCTLSDQRAINDAVAAGSIVVAAIGNGSRNADANPTSPSQCDNVIGVLATDHNGHRTNYSSYGADADIAAPGGRVPDSSFAILVASNAGERAPSSQQTYRQVTGTSIAAPHVSGVLALMQAANPSLTNYELEGLLYRSVRPHNTISGSGCTDRTCGWGLLDAYESVVNAIEFTSGDELPIPQLSPALDGSITRGNQSFGCSVVSGTVSEKPHKMAIDWFLLLLMSSTCLVIRKTVRFRSDDAIR